MNYTQFIESKKHSSINFGIEPQFIPESMFDFQKHVTEYAIKKGRCAVFLDRWIGGLLPGVTWTKSYRHRVEGKLFQASENEYGGL